MRLQWGNESNDCITNLSFFTDFSNTKCKYSLNKLLSSLKVIHNIG